MERLTERLGNNVINVKYASQHENAIHRLATIEDILGDEYDLDLLQKQIQAYREGRFVAETAGSFSGDFSGYPISDCYKSYEEAEAALQGEQEEKR